MYHPDQARYARLAAAEIGAQFVDLDDGNGYLFVVRAHGRQFLSGAGLICSYPINSAASFGISRDKAHAKSVLRAHDIPVIDGSHFFLHDTFVNLRNPGHERVDAPPYARRLGFPVFCKPLAGARGDFAEIVCDDRELLSYMDRVACVYPAMLIEPLMRGDEYRVVVHDGRPLFSVRKTPPVIVGDGRRSAGALLAALNAELAGTGVSPFTPTALALSGVAASAVPGTNERIALAGRRNLTSHGGIDRFDTAVPDHLARLGIACCAALGLRIGAVDLFDVSAARDGSQLVVIEVNGNPALRAAEQAGHLRLIVDLWKSMMLEVLER